MTTTWRGTPSCKGGSSIIVPTSVPETTVPSSEIARLLRLSSGGGAAAASNDRSLSISARASFNSSLRVEEGVGIGIGAGAETSRVTIGAAGAGSGSGSGTAAGFSDLAGCTKTETGGGGWGSSWLSAYCSGCCWKLESASKSGMGCPFVSGRDCTVSYREGRASG